MTLKVNCNVCTSKSMCGNRPYCSKFSIYVDSTTGCFVDKYPDISKEDELDTKLWSL